MLSITLPNMNKKMNNSKNMDKLDFLKIIIFLDFFAFCFHLLTAKHTKFFILNEKKEAFVVYSFSTSPMNSVANRNP